MDEMRHFLFMVREHPLHQFFSQIYVIVIPERKKRTFRVMKEMGISPIPVDAFLRDDLPSLCELLDQGVVNSKFFLNLFGQQLSLVEDVELMVRNGFLRHDKERERAVKGKIALHMTLLKLCEDFLETDASHMFVFEDDLATITDRNQHCERIHSVFGRELPGDWDIVNLGRAWDFCQVNRRYSQHLVSETYPLCTHAMAYSRLAAQRILERTHPIFHAGDHMLRDVVFSDPTIRTFSAVEALFHQDRKNYETTLGNHREHLPECMTGRIPPHLLVPLDDP